MKGDLPLLLALAPLALLAFACFAKISIVLSLLARAIGGRALPAGVVAVVAALLVFVVVAPTAEKALGDGGAALLRGDATAVATQSGGPVRAFLEAHTPPDGRQEMLELQRGLRAPAERASLHENDLVVLAPAFAVSELSVAFKVGFFVLLPFLLLDLLVGVALLALGLHTLSARVVSLPLKLLLFVAAGGWSLLVRALLVGYTA